MRTHKKFSILVIASIVLLPMQPALAQFAGGAGTVGDPWQISNCSELEQADNLDIYYDDHFILISNIDCAGEPGSGYPLWPRANQGGRQDGIGAFGGAYSFGGTFDGQGFSIANRHQSFLNTQRPPKGGTPAVYRNIVFTNMFITNHPLVQLSGVAGVLPAMYSGANPSFFNIHVHGIVSNMTGSGSTGGMIAGCSGATISNCTSSATVYGGGSVGGLIGYASLTTVSNCTATGNVRHTSTGGGGLVGYLYQSLLHQCSAGGDVTKVGSVEYTGGLVGIVTGGSTIRECFASGNIIRTGGQAGGFAGGTEDNGGGDILIEDCYSTGDNASAAGMGPGRNGGFVGNYGRDAGSVHLINRCYSKGDMGTTSGGGFMGRDSGAGNASRIIISNSYASGSTVANSSAGFANSAGFGVTIVNCYFTNNATSDANATKVVNEAYFYNTANAPVDGWNSSTIWCFDGASDPCLRWNSDCCPPPKGSVIWFQ